MAPVTPLQQLEQAQAFVTARYSAHNTSDKLLPRIGFVLGSGLTSLSSALQDAVVIPYSQIPSMPSTSVAGHTGQLILGLWHGHMCAMCCGRVHAYEAATPQQVVFPVRLLALLGIKTLILTNASGALQPQAQPGSLLLVRDHINMTGSNPLVGANIESLGPRFPDMTDLYARTLRASLVAAAHRCGVGLDEGVYAGMLGPSYETPAEIAMLRTLGADAVGMSTVLEAIAAGHAGISVGCISVLTNHAAGITGQKLTHAEVLARGKQAAVHLHRLFDTWLASEAPG